MKNFIFAFCLLLSLSVFSQQYGNSVKVDLESLPQVVRDGFKSKYPEAKQADWVVSHISYWYNDHMEGWYDGWYKNRDVAAYKFEKANFYQVTFQNATGEISRALFTRYGFWHETRTQLSELPPQVKKGLSKTIYSDWSQSKHKEKIEAMGWPDVVYRLEMTKDKRIHIIRLDQEGKVIQVKQL